MTPAEFVSEMLYGGKTLDEIASYDDWQLANVVCRKRDKWGKLLGTATGPDGEELPPWVHVDEHGQRVVNNPTSFGKMFQSAKKAQGLKDWEATRAWHAYSDENPRARQ